MHAGADDEGLHQRGPTEPLRLGENKARPKAADVGILDRPSQLTPGAIHTSYQLYPSHRPTAPPPNPFLFVCLFVCCCC